MTFKAYLQLLPVESGIKHLINGPNSHFTEPVAKVFLTLQSDPDGKYIKCGIE